MRRRIALANNEMVKINPARPKLDQVNTYPQSNYHIESG